jgi:hypothetical protein
MSKFALYRANLEFHAEWLRDEPDDATATGLGSYIAVAWCQLSPGDGEHEIKVRGFYFRIAITSFPIRRRGLRFSETFSPEAPLFQRCSSCGRLQDSEWRDGSLRTAMS